jgi:hypothetical protein
MIQVQGPDASSLHHSGSCIGQGVKIDKTGWCSWFGQARHRLTKRNPQRDVAPLQFPNSKASAHKRLGG